MVEPTVKVKLVAFCQLTVVPEGLATLSVGVPVNPFRGFTVTGRLKAPSLPPETEVCDVGETERLKSGCATTSVAVAVCVRLPLVPVMVSG